MISRRGVLSGLVSALAAPAIVRATSLMPIRVPKLIIPDYHVDLYDTYGAFDRLLGLPMVIWMTRSDADLMAAGLHPRYTPVRPAHIMGSRC